MRLIKKGAEDRYQTAHGVLADVEELLGRWTAGLKLEASPFDLCETDHPLRLILPTHLVARRTELGVLEETCERAARKGGGLHVVMLKGLTGTGKSKLLMEAKRIACVKRAFFATAKFDQYKQGLPLGAFMIIFRSLVRVSPSFLSLSPSKCKLDLKRLYRGGRNISQS